MSVSDLHLPQHIPSSGEAKCEVQGTLCLRHLAPAYGVRFKEPGAVMPFAVLMYFLSDNSGVPYNTLSRVYRYCPSVLRCNICSMVPGHVRSIPLQTLDI